MQNIRRVLVVLVFMTMFAIPYYIILSPIPASFWQQSSASTNTAIITRLLGVTIFTSVTQQILTQTYRPFFNATFPTLLVRRYHIVAGTTTLIVALLHPLAHYLSDYLGGQSLMSAVVGQEYPFPMRYFYLLGPVAITILIATALAGLLRLWKPVQRYWVVIHRLNYLLFAVALFHSWNIGSDVMTSTTLRVLWVGYSVAIGFGFISKFYLRPYAIRTQAGLASSAPIDKQTDV